MTKAYAELIGDPISQSKSPAIHSFWLHKLKIAAEYRVCHISSGQLADYLRSRSTDPDWRGCNITMPYKQAVLPLLSRLDPLAARIGAVNTVVRADDGSLAGFNTDAPGFLEPLRSALDQRHLFRMARVLGTGGAARAIIAALAGRGVLIVLAGRDLGKAQALLDTLDPAGGHYVVPLSHFAEPTDFAFDDRAGCFDLVVNASALGMIGQPSLAFDMSHAPPGAICYDIVTSPVETAFLTAARAAGRPTIDGLAMLIGQAAIAFEKFFGQPPPREHDPELRARLTA